MGDRAVINTRLTRIRRLATGPQFPDQRTVRHEPANRVVQIIRAIHGIVRPDRNAMRPGENAFSPRSKELPSSIEHHYRVLTAIEHKNVVARIDGDRRNFLP